MLRVVESIVTTPSLWSFGCSVTDVRQYAGIVLQLAEHNSVHGTVLQLAEHNSVDGTVLQLAEHNSVHGTVPTEEQPQLCAVFKHNLKEARCTEDILQNCARLS